MRPSRARNLLLVLLCGLLVAATMPQQRGGRGGRGGRAGRGGRSGQTQRARQAAETARALAHQKAQQARAQQALKERLATMKRRTSVARRQAQAYQQGLLESSGSGLLQTFQQRCTSCHTYPDPDSKTDQAWLRRVGVTSCDGTPPRAREPLANYLTALEGLHPRTLTSDAEPTRAQVSVTTTLETGEVFLKARGGVVYRLRWDEGSEGEARVVPAGVYTLLGYRVVSGPWIIAATGGKRQIMLAPGRPRHIPIETAVRARLQVGRNGKQASVELELTGSDGMGVGIYGGGYPIPIPYVVVQDSTIVGQGTLRNMGSGRNTAAFTPPKGNPARVRVELPTSLPVALRGATTTALPQAANRASPASRPRR